MEKIIVVEEGLILLFNSFTISIEQALLILLLLTAAIIDIRSKKIPNKLILIGSLFAVLYNAATPAGFGIVGSLGGFAIGLFAFMPLYALRLMGAGDVKLIAMVGAFLGPTSILGAILSTLLAGGILAILVAIWNRAAVNAFKSTGTILLKAIASLFEGAGNQAVALQNSTGKLPYGVAIASGTILHLILLRNSSAFIN